MRWLLRWVREEATRGLMGLVRLGTPAWGWSPRTPGYWSIKAEIWISIQGCFNRSRCPNSSLWQMPFTGLVWLLFGHSLGFWSIREYPTLSDSALRVFTLRFDVPLGAQPLYEDLAGDSRVLVDAIPDRWDAEAHPSVPHVLVWGSEFDGTLPGPFRLFPVLR